MRHLTFLHSNDIHGRLDALARLTTVARQVQVQAQAAGRTVFRWDAGDAFDRRFEQCRLTRGVALPPVLEAAGVTLQTLGNDLWISYGPAALARMTQRAIYPILAANLRAEDGSPIGRLQSSVLLDSPDGLKLGVFGLTDSFRGTYAGYSHGQTSPEQLAQQLIDDLRAQGAGVVVFLSHLGLERDREFAQHLSGLNLILGGHTHHLLPAGEWIGTTLIAQAGEFAEHLGRVDLDIDRDGTIIRAVAQVLPIAGDIPPDPAVVQAITALEQEVADFGSEVVGTLTQAAPVDHYANSPLANLVAEALRTWGEAEVGLISGGAVQQGLSAGPVSRLDVGSAVTAPLNPVVSEVTGAALRAALERGVMPEVVSFHLRGLRGAPVGVPGLSGMDVTLNPTAPVGSRVAEVTVNGEPLQEAQVYRVAHSDLETDAVSFLTAPDVQEIRADFTVLIEDVTREYLRQHSPATPGTVRPWRNIHQITLRIED